MTGLPVDMGGPTGRSIKRPLSEQSQLKLWETIGRKLQPDLSAQAIKAAVTTETIHTEPADPREVAKGIITILKTAKLADEPVSEPAPAPAPPAQLLIGRDDIIEIEAHQVCDATTGVLSPRASGPADGLPPTAGLGVRPDAISHLENGRTLSLENGAAVSIPATSKGGVAVSSISATSPHEARADNRAHVARHEPKVIRRAPR